MRASRYIVGDRIRQLRLQKNLTQKQLADLLNTDRQYICKLEKGKVPPSLKYLDKIMATQGVTYADFFQQNKKY